MEILTKIIEILKIPLKVILPAMWLFSGLLTLFSDDILNKLFLLEWRNENGFILGIIFLVTSCLILVYVFLYIKNKVSNIFFKSTLKRKTIKRLFELDDTRFDIIVSLYKATGYTKYLNYGEPLVQSLLAENYIYAGDQQIISIDLDTNGMQAKFTLQPFVYQALDYYKDEMMKKINKLSKKVNSEKNTGKKEKLQEQLDIEREKYSVLYN